MRAILIVPNSELKIDNEINDITAKVHTKVLTGRLTVRKVWQECDAFPADLLIFVGHALFQDAPRPISNTLVLGAEEMTPDQLVRAAQLCGAKCVLLNSCMATYMAAYAVSHGIEHVICATVSLGDSTAWEFPKMFMEYLEENDGRVANWHDAFVQANSSRPSGEYLHTGMYRRSSELQDILSMMDQLRLDMARSLQSFHGLDQAFKIFGEIGENGGIFITRSQVLAVLALFGLTLLMSLAALGVTLWNP